MYEKGIESLIQVSSDDLITQPFADAALNETVSHVHKKCRVNFLTNHKRTPVLMDDGPEIVAKNYGRVVNSSTGKCTVSYVDHML